MSRRGRPVSRLVTCLWAWGTRTRHPPVGQEGRGPTHQRPVRHGRPIRARLGLAEPPPRRGVGDPRRHVPAWLGRLDEPCVRVGRGVAHHPPARAGRLGSPALDPDDLGDAGPVGLARQRPAQVRDLPPTPPPRQGEHPPPALRARGPVPRPVQRPTTRVEGCRPVDAAEQEALRPHPPPRGRGLQACPSARGWPLLPRRSNPRCDLTPTSRSTGE